MTPEQLLRETVTEVCMYLGSRGIEPQGRTVLDVVRFVVERCESERETAMRVQGQAAMQLEELTSLRRMWRDQRERIQQLEHQIVAMRLKEHP